MFFLNVKINPSLLSDKVKLAIMNIIWQKYFYFYLPYLTIGGI